MLPVLTKNIVENDWDSVRGLWKSSVDKISTICLPISAFLSAFSHQFIVNVFGEKYIGSAIIFTIFTLLAPIKCISFGLVLRASGKPFYDVIGASFYLVVSTVTVYLGITIYGSVGAALGVVLSTLLLALFMTQLVRKETDGQLKFFDLIPYGFFVKYALFLGVAFLCKYIYEYLF